MPPGTQDMPSTHRLLAFPVKIPLQGLARAWCSRGSNSTLPVHGDPGFDPWSGN